MEKRVQEALNFRGGRGGREQESQKDAHEQVPEPESHVPVADVGDDAHDQDERDRDCHFASLPSGSASVQVAGLMSMKELMFWPFLLVCVSSGKPEFWAWRIYCWRLGLRLRIR